MDFAKPNLDVGLFTNKKEEQLAFWSNVAGLQFDHTLKLGGGVLQHRFTAHGAIVKVNDSRSLLPRHVPQPISRLAIAAPQSVQAHDYVDPEGNMISLVPPGHQGITSIAVYLPVKDVSASSEFFVNALGLERMREGVLRCGQSLLFLERAEQTCAPGDLIALGLRYLTLQVVRCDDAHAAALKAGAREGRPPATLGTTARISFVISPDELWIELSERASLTGRAVSG
jgi:catechol 2,3-dioxygenase-like lactoylglutathione lyase family enzyme